jgi:hypothetical protein
MRLPAGSERDAYKITWATVAVVVVAVALGAPIHPLVGVALVVIAVIAAVVWDVRAPNPDRVDVLREAAGTGRAHAVDTKPRLLVVANQAVDPPKRRDFEPRTHESRCVHAEKGPSGLGGARSVFGTRRPGQRVLANARRGLGRLSRID